MLGLLLLLPVLLLLMSNHVPNRLLLRLLVDRPVMLLPHNSLLDTLHLGRGPPERGHGGLRRRRLHRHRPGPARRVLERHYPDRLPVRHVHHAALLPWLLDDDLLAVLQHQHPRLPAAAVSRPQDLPDPLHGLLHNDAVLLLLLGMVLNVLGLLLRLLLVHHHPRLLLLLNVLRMLLLLLHVMLLWMGVRLRRNLLLHIMHWLLHMVNGLLLVVHHHRLLLRMLLLLRVVLVHDLVEAVVLEHLLRCRSCWC